MTVSHCERLVSYCKFHYNICSSTFLFICASLPHTVLLECYQTFLGAFVKLRKATVSFVLSVWNNSATAGRIFMKFEICVFLETLLRKFKFH